jgi:hypothetical protein
MRDNKPNCSQARFRVVTYHDTLALAITKHVLLPSTSPGEQSYLAFLNTLYITTYQLLYALKRYLQAVSSLLCHKQVHLVRHKIKNTVTLFSIQSTHFATYTYCLLGSNPTYQFSLYVLWLLINTILIDIMINTRVSHGSEASNNTLLATNAQSIWLKLNRQ